MPQDFAKQRAARADRASHANKQPAAPWLWFVSGTVIGSLCTFLFFLTSTAPQPAPTAATARSAPAEKPATATPKAAATGKPQFDFYTLLPESEVIVGDRGTNPNAGKGAQPAAGPPALLLLQAGSFRNQAEADRRRGEIILLGFEARVETVTVPSEGTWYRVHVGPFPNAEALGSARRALGGQGVETIEIGRRQG